MTYYAIDIKDQYGRKTYLEGLSYTDAFNLVRWLEQTYQSLLYFCTFHLRSYQVTIEQVLMGRS